jgi:hypothetical protein
MSHVDEAAVKAAIWRWPAAQRYWRGRRAKAPAAIAWHIDPSIYTIERAQGLATWRPSGPVLVLWRMPQSLEDAACVCHELCHFELDLQGYPSLACMPDSPEATQRLHALGNGALDLLINDRLRALGFVLSPPAAGPNPFDRLARQMGYTTPAQMRQVMQRIIDDNPGAAGLYMESDMRTKVNQCQSH